MNGTQDPDAGRGLLDEREKRARGTRRARRDGRDGGPGTGTGAQALRIFSLEKLSLFANFFL